MLELREQIEKWLEPVLQDGEVFLIDVKVLLGGKKIEVFLDTDSGIAIDQCAAISRRLEKHLDESSLVPENYVLEVSSPGMNNPLKVPRQFKKRIGRVLEIWTTDGDFAQGILRNATDTSIEIEKAVKSKTKEQTLPPTPANHLNIEYKKIKKALLQLNW
jgi:ribosome maturation factor RimP